VTKVMRQHAAAGIEFRAMRPIIAALVPFAAMVLAIFCSSGLLGLGEVARDPISWFICVSGFALSYALARPKIT